MIDVPATHHVGDGLTTTDALIIGATRRVMLKADAELSLQEQVLDALRGHRSCIAIHSRQMTHQYTTWIARRLSLVIYI